MFENASGTHSVKAFYSKVSAQNADKLISV
jgi:hypothetical protein